MKRPLILAALIAAGATGVSTVALAPTALVAATETTAPAAPAPPSVTVVTAQKQRLVETLDVTGTILPWQEASVGVDLNGMIVVELRADVGDTVRKGDVLAVLDRSMLDTQLAQADANRAQAQASIAQVKAQITDAEIGVRQADEALRRARELQKRGVAAQSQLDNAVNAYDSAGAKLVSAQKALAASEAQLGVLDAQRANVLVQLGKTEVKAPADGLVLARNASLGGVVTAGGGALFRIAVDSKFELSAETQETSLARLATGMPAGVRVAGSDAAVKGFVRRIDPEIDQRTRMGIVKIALDAGAPARAGNFARGAIELAAREGVAVPASALIYRSGEAFLQRVAAGKVETVPVTLGVRAGGYVEITGGVDAGDDVVSRAGTFVADGDMVTPVRSEQTGALQK